MFFGEPILQNESMIIINKLKSNDNECLRALEMINDDLLYDTKKYNFSRCSQHIVKLIQTKQNINILENATQCLRTAVEVNPENVEMLMTSSTIEIICQIFNKKITEIMTEHTIHILHAISKYSYIALSNSLDYDQIFQFINNTNSSDIEKRLLSSILLNITQVSVSDFLVSQIHQLIYLCNHNDNQIAFNSLSSLINIARGLDSTLVPIELTDFLCDKLMDPKLHKVHKKLIELLTNLAKDKNHALVIHQKNLDFERLLFSPEFINSQTDFSHILNLILNLLPFAQDLSIFGLSPHKRPSQNDFDIFGFSRQIKNLMKRVIIEKPLDVKTALIVYAVTLECSKNENLLKAKDHPHQELHNDIFDINFDESLFSLNDANFENDSDYTPFYDDQELGYTGLIDEDNSISNDHKQAENNEDNHNNEKVTNKNDEGEKEIENSNDNEIDNDLLMALISFSMIAANAPYILAVISYYDNSAKINECYLLQLIKDFPIQPEYQIWFRHTVKKLEDSLSKISMPRPLIDLSTLSLQQINELAQNDQIPSYQFLFGGGAKICRKLLEEEKISFCQSRSDLDISGIAKLAFSLVSLLPMPIMMGDPSMDDFINILINPAPVSIISNIHGRFKSSVPLIEPIWTLKSLVDMTVCQKGPTYLLRLMTQNKKLAKYIRIESVKEQSARPANTAVLIKSFENYSQSISASYNQNLTNLNSNPVGLTLHSALNIPRSNTTSNFHTPTPNIHSFNPNINNANSTSTTSSNNNALTSLNVSPRRQIDTDSTAINPLHIADTNDRLLLENHNSSPRSSNQRILRRRVENNTTTKSPTTLTNSTPNKNSSNGRRKFILNFGFNSQEKDLFYPDYENNSIFSIFCDKAQTASDITKIQPEINLNEKPTKVKFEPLPNQYFIELFSLLKDLHDNYDIKPSITMMRSFVSRVHEQLSNPFGSIGRKSYVMTLIFIYPFLFPFNERILAYKLVYLDPYFATRRLISEFKSYDSIALRPHKPEPLKFQVRRDHLFEDGCYLLKYFFTNKIEVNVQFHGEDGIGMGPTREFLFNISREFSRVKNKMFRNDSTFSNSDNDYCFSENGLFPAPIADPEMFRLLGILVAKSITMECNLDLDFNPAFFEIARGKKISVSKIDTNIANCLNCQDDGLFGLNFTYPGCSELELTTNGKNMIVNEKNIDEYVELIEYLTVDGNVKKCVELFVNGFNRILPFSSLDIFSEEEIGSVIRGEKELMTSSDLTKYCQLDGFTNESPEILMLFQTVGEMDSVEQKDFLKFVTGSSNLPIGGLKVLEPPMTVKRYSASTNQDLELPTSNTCNCTLKLPSYSTKDVLLNRLKTAFSFGNCEFGRS